MAYTDPGQRNKLIDIYDRPPNSLPVIFQTGIYAKIEGVSSTTPSQASTELNQNIVWPRLVGQDMSLITHKVNIGYIAGLKSRMYIVYDDPDNGPRRFDIDRIVDPDEQKVELQILALERVDGADPFDAMLTSTLDILERDTAPGDELGISDPTFATIATGIPCRIAQGKGVERGKESRSKTTTAIAYREVYMRPWYRDPAPNGSYVPFTVLSGVTYNTQGLTHNHWFLVPSSASLNSNHEAVPGEQYDILEIKNPGLASQYLEVSCEVVLP